MQIEVSIVVWLRHITLKLLWRTLENDVVPVKVPLFHTFQQTFLKKFVILVFFNKYSPFVTIFIMIYWKLGPIQGILYFYLTWKFAAVLKVCQRWRHKKIQKTCLTLDLDLILICSFLMTVLSYSLSASTKILFLRRH